MRRESSDSRRIRFTGPPFGLSDQTQPAMDVPRLNHIIVHVADIVSILADASGSCTVTDHRFRSVPKVSGVRKFCKKGRTRALFSQLSMAARAAENLQLMNSQQFDRVQLVWPQSCLNVWHNMVIRGERELRGERHGKGGRSLLLTAASSFCICLVFAQAAESQVRVLVSAGMSQSGVVVRDAIASPILRSRLGRGVEEEVTAKFATAPMAGVGVEIPLRPGTHVVITGGWSGTTLRATDGGGTRDVQDVTILQGIFGLRRRLGNTVEASGGFGAMHFSASDRALFGGGASVAPMVEAGLGGGRDLGGHRARIRAVGQLHRFGTSAMSSVGGRSGNVRRYGVEASFTWNGAVMQ